MINRCVTKPLSIVLMFLLLSACKDMANILEQVDQLQGNGALDETTIRMGLKDALRVGSDRAVQSVSQLDGFLTNELIRIAMPKELVQTTQTLRKLGFNKEVDEFELAMNRAAEKSTEGAKQAFWNVITQMTFDDVMAIWKGDEQAATQFFRDKTETSLRSHFQPIVQQKMQEVGLYQTYNQILDTYARIPFVKQPTFNLDQYIVDNTVGGLFTVLGQEEARIRQDPAARTTELLKKVFR